MRQVSHSDLWLVRRASRSLLVTRVTQEHWVLRDCPYVDWKPFLQLNLIRVHWSFLAKVLVVDATATLDDVRNTF